MSGDLPTEGDVEELVDLTPEQWARIGPLVHSVIAQQRRFDGVDLHFGSMAARLDKQDGHLERLEGVLLNVIAEAQALAAGDRDVTTALTTLTSALEKLQQEMRELRHAQERQAAAAEAQLEDQQKHNAKQAAATAAARESSEDRWKDALSIGSKVSLGVASLAVIAQKIWEALQGQGGP